MGVLNASNITSTTEVVVAPPSVYLHGVAQKLRGDVKVRKHDAELAGWCFLFFPPCVLAIINICKRSKPRLFTMKGFVVCCGALPIVPVYSALWKRVGPDHLPHPANFLRLTLAVCVCKRAPTIAVYAKDGAPTRLHNTKALGFTF